MSYQIPVGEMVTGEMSQISSLKRMSYQIPVGEMVTGETVGYL